MKKSSTFIGFIIAIAAVVWYYSDARTNHAEERPYELYQQGDYAAATPELTQRAEQGDGKAQYYLGWIAIKQGDDARGLEWWHKASENGYAYASYNIGVSYLEGKRGVEEDISLARQWLQKALAQGYGGATAQLYQIDTRRYYAYIGRTQDEIAAQAVIDAAPKWLEQGVLLGDREALIWLSSAYSAQAYPIERAAELIPAVHAMEKTLKNKSGEFASEGLEEGYYTLLGVLYFAEADYANALINLEKAKNTPYKDDLFGSVAYHLGRMYEEGLGNDSDARKARESYATTSQNARTKDDRLAMWHLAMMQAQGRGGDVDKTSAAALLQKLESVSRDDVLSPAVLEFPGAEQMDALREAIAAP